MHTVLESEHRFPMSTSLKRESPPPKAAAKLAPGELRQFILLGIPSLGLSLAATTQNAYVPVLARDLTSSHVVIGALVSGEGFFSLLLPIWIGAASDRVKTRLGPRLPFMIVTAPIAALALACTPLARSIPALVVAVGVYFLAYFTYFAPYRALVSDLVPREHGGRVNAVVGIFRATGMGCALVGGALLLHLWKPLPYLVAASMLIVTTAISVLALRRDAARAPAEVPKASATERVWSLIRDHADIRRFIVANLLWQLTETGLRAFIVLYLTRGLRTSFSFAALAMGIVAAGAIVAAPVAGKLADRYGPIRVMRPTLAVFGIGLCTATFAPSLGWLLAELPIVGFGGAMALSLPYAILMRMMPRESHGAAAGLFDVSSGAGSILGPLLTGAAIDVLRPLFESTKGYAAMWAVIGTATLLSIPLLKERPHRDAVEEPLAGTERRL
jgi:MFS family permease